MNPLLVYAFKSGFYLAAFYLVYHLLLRSDTSYSRNRAFIILSMLAAIVLPGFSLHNLNTLYIQSFGRYLSDVLVYPGANEAGHPSSGLTALDPRHIIYIVYITGVVFFIFRLILDMLNLMHLILKQKGNDGNIIKFHGFSTAGFSAMGYVFINAILTPEEAEGIIRHEQNHLKRNHFIDIIFVDLIKAFQWFNPAAYLFNKSLRAIHEFQADESCISSGIPLAIYQKLLLNQVFKTKTFNLSNSFSNPSMIRSRMIMMSKKRTSALANMKLLTVIPVVGFVLLILSAFGLTGAAPSQTDVTGLNLNKTEKSSEVPYVQVEQMPVFPGGEEALLKYLGQNAIYPENAKKNNIQGRVLLRFCVNTDGSVDRITVLSGVDPEIDAEAIRLAGTLPRFEPARNGGRVVPVWYMIPITFTLK